MPTLAERIIEALAKAGHPMEDGQLAKQLGAIHQAVNQTCRNLEKQGKLKRVASVGGNIRNVLPGRWAAPETSPTPPPVPGGLLTEDEVKAAVRDHLRAQGYTVDVAWAKQHGIDIEAHGREPRLVIEAKGAAANPPQQVNYFLGALGELVQRLSDPDARYGLALPDNKQYRNLVKKLPSLGRERLDLVVYFVGRTESGYVVEEA